MTRERERERERERDPFHERREIKLLDIYIGTETNPDTVCCVSYVQEYQSVSPQRQFG